MVLEGYVIRDPTTGGWLDSELVRWLYSVGPFDAVVCWLIGTHKLDAEIATSPSAYRLRVQNATYELASKLLSPGGMLHVVDRGTVPSSEVSREETRQLLWETHCEQATVTDLTVSQDIEFFPYEMLAEGEGTKMVFQRAPSENETSALWSIVSTKP